MPVMSHYKTYEKQQWIKRAETKKDSQDQEDIQDKEDNQDQEDIQDKEDSQDQEDDSQNKENKDLQLIDEAFTYRRFGTYREELS